MNNFKIKLNMLQVKVKLPSSPLPRVTARAGCAMCREGVFLFLTAVSQGTAGTQLCSHWLAVTVSCKEGRGAGVRWIALALWLLLHVVLAE